MRIVVFGAGAIGCTVYGWLAEQHRDAVILARGASAARLRGHGLTLYHRAAERSRTVSARVVTSLDETRPADVVVLAVKNYHLEEAARTVRDALGDSPFVLGLQNGVENQGILPRFFSRVAYGVIGYNAWVDSPGVVGYQKKGPIILGALDGRVGEDLAATAHAFNRGVETIITERLRDAVHCKLVLNLTNSLTTLAGHTYRAVSDRRLLQHILSTLLIEGLQVIQAAGCREYRIGGMPGWFLMRASARLPYGLTALPFRMNLRKMVKSSMAQDVFQRDPRHTELESINGYLLELAGKHGVHVPYNRALYALCRDAFSRPGFVPLDMNDLWAAMKQHMASDKHQE